MTTILLRTNTKTTYKIVQYFVPKLRGRALSHRRKYSTVPKILGDYRGFLLDQTKYFGLFYKSIWYKTLGK